MADKNTGKKIIPQDRVRAITVDGIQVHTSSQPNDDIEVLQWLDEISGGNVIHLPKLLHRLVGDDYSKVLNHLRDSEGIVRQQPAIEFVMDLFKQESPNS